MTFKQKKKQKSEDDGMLSTGGGLRIRLPAASLDWRPQGKTSSPGWNSTWLTRRRDGTTSFRSGHQSPRPVGFSCQLTRQFAHMHPSHATAEGTCPLPGEGRYSSSVCQVPYGAQALVADGEHETGEATGHEALSVAEAAWAPRLQEGSAQGRQPALPRLPFPANAVL